MTTLLVIIYLAFIGLGLPDSLLGSAWPAMQIDLGAPLGMAGAISMVVTGGTIVASLTSGRMIRRFGTGLVTLVSVALTAMALYGISQANQIWLLFLMAVPLGLGAGSVDAALNNFVALHYKAMHMSWLHCFWGVGATAGPVILSLFMQKAMGWQTGYLIISCIQMALVATLLLSLPLWRKTTVPVAVAGGEEVETPQQAITNGQALALPCVKLALTAFVLYCGIELMAGLWASSFFVQIKGMSAAMAAGCASAFYASITAGRFISGFLTLRFTNQQIIRMGQLLCIGGALLLALPGIVLPVGGLVLLGLGLAPIFPSMLHETPVRFGKAYSQTIMGLQMGFAYMGSCFLPPLLGAIATWAGIGILPISVLLCAVVMLLVTRRLDIALAVKK